MTREELLSDSRTLVKKPGEAYLLGKKYTYTPLTPEEILKEIKQVQGFIDKEMKRPAWIIYVIVYGSLVLIFLGFLWMIWR